MNIRQASTASGDIEAKAAKHQTAMLQEPLMAESPPRPAPTRRAVLAAAAAAGTVLVVRPGRAAQPDSMEAAIREFVGEGSVKPGRVKLAIPPLVENGNSVGLTVAVESAMTAQDHVRRIGVFNEKNPQPNVATFHLTPRSGKASVQTRIRLATSQKLVAVAEMSDGSFWSDQADVYVTLAACLEGD
jgi:sulfur-oxidizing protein SoxY